MASDPVPSELELVAAALERLRPGLDPTTTARLRAADWSAGGVEEGGQFHRVLVLEDVGVLRMARLHEAGAAPGTVWSRERDPAAQLERRVALVDGLAAARLPWPLPVSLSEVVGAEAVRSGAGDDGGAVPVPGPGGTAAVLQTHLPGFPHPPHEGDPAVLRGIVDALAAVDVADPRIAPHLGAPFAFRGPWTAERVAAVAALPERLAGRLGGWPGDAPPTREADSGPDRVQGDATPLAAWPSVVASLTDAVTRWTAEPPVPPCLVHGDLAGHNLRWLPEPGTPVHPEPTWRLAGILDWDLACAWDPALNVAYLGLWHGEELVEDVARDAAEARRARVWLGVMALETLDDAAARDALVGIPDRSWRTLLRKTLPRVTRAVTALG
ncbi:phosphotransferase [Micrococcaceae bacterium Sec6.3]